MEPERRARRGLFVLTAAGLALVATHRGEFWPYSIYPMFSQGGRPWERAIVRDVTDDPSGNEDWGVRTLETLPGAPFALSERDIPQIDFAEYVNHTNRWDEERVAGLRAMFAPYLETRTLRVYSVNGRIDESDRVLSEAVPLVSLGPTESSLNPNLQQR